MTRAVFLYMSCMGISWCNSIITYQNDTLDNDCRKTVWDEWLQFQYYSFHRILTFL